MCADRLHRAVLLGILSFAACGDGTSLTPTSPTPAGVTPAAPPAADQGAGAIEIASVTHGSGSTLTVHDCGPSWTGIAGNHVCTADWRGAFDILIKRDVARAAVTVTFEDAAGRCADTIVSDVTFAAGRSRLVSTQHAVYLTYEPEGYDHLAVTHWCEVPAMKNRLVVSVWDLDGGPGSGTTPVVRREFDYRYEFTAK
jgi:hypothetical protein